MALPMTPLHCAPTSRIGHLRCTALASRREMPLVAQTKTVVIKNGFEQLISGEGRPKESGGENAYAQQSMIPDTTAIGEVIRTWWGSVPARTKLVAACGSSFVISNLDKVNMTVAGVCSWKCFPDRCLVPSSFHPPGPPVEN